MNKIGFDNFRRFIKFDPIEYKGITFLVGRNNAGKSTLVKALLLINEYFKSGQISSFSFGHKILEDANIVTYGRAKNTKAKNGWICFIYQILNYHIELYISGDEDKTSADVQSLLIIDTTKNFNFLFEPVAKTITIQRANLLDNEPVSSTETKKSLGKEIKRLNKLIEESPLKKSSKEYIMIIEELNSLQNKKTLLDKNEKTSKSDNIYSFILDVDMTSNLKDTVDFAIMMGTLYHGREYSDIQKGKKASKHFEGYKGINDDEKLLRESFDDFYELITTQSSFVYLGANSTKQSALFSIRDTNNALAQSIHEFYQLKVTPGEPAFLFIEKWMRIFEVGDSFEVGIHAGEAYELKVKSNDTEIHLADKGTGSIQAMLLILRLASIIHNTIDTDDILTVIIEEPELNLHPALQSKLADMFLEVYEKCYHNFIIETHSEYILRRSQVIVSENEYEIPPNENPFGVYYFPKNLQEPPYRLNYQSDGTFDKNFGEGFFDEASSNTLELLKLKRQKKGLMFTVYTEKEIFENIVVFKDQTPNWYNIFCNHSEICLNLSNDELKNEEVQGTPIFEFILANGGKSPIALKDFFESIYDDNSLIASKPRSAFFLNYSNDQAKDIQFKYGVLVQGNGTVDDSTLKGTFFKDLHKDAVFENKTSKGWKNLVSFSVPPSNAMVVTDDYLFKNEENGQIVGKSNIVNLIDAFLPQYLEVPYHITVITNDNDKSKEWCVRLAGELKAAILALREYQINFEIVFTETIHKRKLILNYINATCDKGFAVFKVDDQKTVRDDNDFGCNRMFNRVNFIEGDTDYLVAESILKQLKSKCTSVKEYINNVGACGNRRVIGDCNPDKSLKNRLINDV